MLFAVRMWSLILVSFFVFAANSAVHGARSAPDRRTRDRPSVLGEHNRPILYAPFLRATRAANLCSYHRTADKRRHTTPSEASAVDLIFAGSQPQSALIHDSKVEVIDAVVHTEEHYAEDGTILIPHSSIYLNRAENCGVKNSPGKHTLVFPGSHLADFTTADNKGLYSAHMVLRDNPLASNVYDQIMNQIKRSPGSEKRFMIGFDHEVRICADKIAFPAGTLYFFIRQNVNFGDPTYGFIGKKEGGPGADTGMMVFKPTGNKSDACLYKGNLTPGIIVEQNVPQHFHMF